MKTTEIVLLTFTSLLCVGISKHTMTVPYGTTDEQIPELLLKRIIEEQQCYGHPTDHIKLESIHIYSISRKRSE